MVMHLVKSIELLTVDRSEHQLYEAMYSRDRVPINGGDSSEDSEILVELVKGRRFRRRDGSYITIGCSKQAADIIGIYYDCWEISDEINRNLRGMVNKRNNALDSITDASFFQRLKWLFKGVSYE